jgi:hypothetical protein
MSGYVHQLAYPIFQEGAEVRTLTVRRPTLDDLIQESKAEGNSIEKDRVMFPILCNCDAEIIGKLDIKDYLALAEVVTGFFSDVGEPADKTSLEA